MTFCVVVWMIVFVFVASVDDDMPCKLCCCAAKEEGEVAEKTYYQLQSAQKPTHFLLLLKMDLYYAPVGKNEKNN